MKIEVLFMMITMGVSVCGQFGVNVYQGSCSTCTGTVPQLLMTKFPVWIWADCQSWNNGVSDCVEANYAPIVSGKTSDYFGIRKLTYGAASLFLEPTRNAHGNSLGNLMVNTDHRIEFSSESALMPVIERNVTVELKLGNHIHCGGAGNFKMRYTNKYGYSKTFSKNFDAVYNSKVKLANIAQVKTIDYIIIDATGSDGLCFTDIRVFEDSLIDGEFCSMYFRLNESPRSTPPTEKHRMLYVDQDTTGWKFRCSYGNINPLDFLICPGVMGDIACAAWG